MTDVMPHLGAPAPSEIDIGTDTPRRCGALRGGDRVTLEQLIERLHIMGPGWLRAMGCPRWLDEDDVIQEADIRLLKLHRREAGPPVIRTPDGFLRNVLRFALRDAIRKFLRNPQPRAPSEEDGQERDEPSDARAPDAFDRVLGEVDGCRACLEAHQALRPAPRCPEHAAMKASHAKCDSVVHPVALWIVHKSAGHAAEFESEELESILIDALAHFDPERFGHNNRGTKARRDVVLCVLWSLHEAARGACLPWLLVFAHHRLVLELPRRTAHHVAEHRRRRDGPSWERTDALLHWLEDETACPGVIPPENGSGPVLDAVLHCPRQWIVNNLHIEIEQLDASVAELERLAGEPCPHDHEYQGKVASLIEGAGRCRATLVRRLDGLEP